MPIRLSPIPKFLEEVSRCLQEEMHTRGIFRDDLTTAFITNSLVLHREIFKDRAELTHTSNTESIYPIRRSYFYVLLSSVDTEMIRLLGCLMVVSVPSTVYSTALLDIRYTVSFPTGKPDHFQVTSHSKKYHGGSWMMTQRIHYLSSEGFERQTVWQLRGCSLPVFSSVIL